MAISIVNSKLISTERLGSVVVSLLCFVNGSLVCRVNVVILKILNKLRCVVLVPITD